MAGNLTHEFELYTPETFKILLEHEVNKSRRYRNPLTLIHLSIEAEPNEPTTQCKACRPASASEWRWHER